MSLKVYWDEAGKLYYIDPQDGLAYSKQPAHVHLLPEDLAEQPWKEGYNPDNRKYWYNPIARVSSWEMPEVYQEYMAIVHNSRPYPFQTRSRVLYDGEPAPFPAHLQYPFQREPPHQRLTVHQKHRGSSSRGKTGENADRYKGPKIPTPVPDKEMNKLSCHGCGMSFASQKSIGVPCARSHRYCVDCIAQIFLQAMKKDVFAPRCCGTIIPLEILDDAGIGEIFGRPARSEKKAEKKTEKKTEKTLVNTTKQTKGKGKGTAHLPEVQCVICMEDLGPEEAITANTCPHIYCRLCLRDHYLKAMQEEALYPPTCCSKDLPASLANIVLSATELTEFKAKGVEFRTKDRVYCSNMKCLTFLPPSQIRGDRGKCIKCGHWTCAYCKRASHSGDCPKDKAIQGVLKLAEESGWKRCYNCREMCELSEGCNHITCRCGAQFCYICGRRWKTCECKQWDTENLQRFLEEERATEGRARNAPFLGLPEYNPRRQLPDRWLG